mgnify:CR=1 FL=1
MKILRIGKNKFSKNTRILPLKLEIIWSTTKRAEPGFEPGTSCTQSRNHTSRPHGRWEIRPRFAHVLEFENSAMTKTQTHALIGTAKK